PPPPPPPPPPTRPTVRFVEMVVKKQEEVREEEEPIEIPKDDKAEISTKTQEGDPDAKITEPVVTEAPVVEEPKVFQFVEQMPEFPGGEGELLKYLAKNTQYPQMERDNDIQGRVMLRFVVLEDGSVSDVTVVRGVSPGLDKEAVRVVKTMPKFKPGRQQGKPVRVYYNLPFMFKLQ
ncbi:MAG TPA: TonB family protein, partial [Chitinophagales bacterium]|nr:TonB family protein [Chitinophagales bacterium]